MFLICFIIIKIKRIFTRKLLKLIKAVGIFYFQYFILDFLFC